MVITWLPESNSAAAIGYSGATERLAHHCPRRHLDLCLHPNKNAARNRIMKCAVSQYPTDNSCCFYPHKAGRRIDASEYVLERCISISKICIFVSHYSTVLEVSTAHKNKQLQVIMTVRRSAIVVHAINQSININFFSWRHMSRKSESEAPMDGNQWRDV